MVGTGALTILGVIHVRIGHGVAAQIPSHAVLLRSTAVLDLTLTQCLSNIIVND